MLKVRRAHFWLRLQASHMCAHTASILYLEILDLRQELLRALAKEVEGRVALRGARRWDVSRPGVCAATAATGTPRGADAEAPEALAAVAVATTGASSSRRSRGRADDGRSVDRNSAPERASVPLGGGSHRATVPVPQRKGCARQRGAPWPAEFLAGVAAGASAAARDGKLRQLMVGPAGLGLGVEV